MLVLVHKSPVTLERYRHPNLGLLVSPRGGSPPARVAKWVWAADNDAFGDAWDEVRYLRMLEKLAGLEGCLFVTAPDVVGDAAATLKLFDLWRSEITDRWLPVALVAQDGLTDETTPWEHIDALFIGGTTAWKLGPQAQRLVRAANVRDKWTHMGRVNTRQRIKWAKAIGCRSIDGTNFSRFTDAALPWALEWCASDQQMPLVSA